MNPIMAYVLVARFSRRIDKGDVDGVDWGDEFAVS
jgi:hypothetical protein